jgi:hypothetical protein
MIAELHSIMQKGPRQVNDTIVEALNFLKGIGEMSMVKRDWRRNSSCLSLSLRRFR